MGAKTVSAMRNRPSTVLAVGDAIPAVEREVALDMVRHGMFAAPVIIGGAGIVRGLHGLNSAAIAVALVFVNFLVAAAIMTRAAHSGPTAIGVAAAVGYPIRLGAIVVALVILRHQPWIDLPTLGIVLVGTHVGLLFWEMKYVSMSLAAPGLRPTHSVSRALGDQ